MPICRKSSLERCAKSSAVTSSRSNSMRNLSKPNSPRITFQVWTAHILREDLDLPWSVGPPQVYAPVPPARGLRAPLRPAQDLAFAAVSAVSQPRARLARQAHQLPLHRAVGCWIPKLRQEGPPDPLHWGRACLRLRKGSGQGVGWLGPVSLHANVGRPLYLSSSARRSWSASFLACSKAAHSGFTVTSTAR